jgi:alcohol dehydrogenase
VTEAEAAEFHNPTRVVFGAGTLERLPEFTSGTVLLVTTSGQTRRGVTARVRSLLAAELVVYDGVEPNPTIDRLSAAASELRGQAIGMVVGLGGGSALDTAKVLRLALADPSFDVRAAATGAAPTDAVQALPLVAVPTTAGTGSEVTPTATVWDEVTRTKHSIGTKALFPDVAIVDPELALGLSWEATLGPGLDAYSQCFEAIWNRNAVPATSEHAARGLGLVPDALRTLRADLASIEARTAMAQAALLSGLAISHTRTALAHSMSYPITAHLGLAHGLACGLVLPAVLAYNLETDASALTDAVGVSDSSELVAQVRRLYEDLGVAQTIGAVIGFQPDLRALADQMLTPGRADNNIRPADLDDVRRILAETEAWLAEASAR